MNSDFDDRPADLERIKASALRILTRRDHSVEELRRKIWTRFNITDETWQELISYLRRYNYLVNEDNLSERHVAQWRSEGRGRHWITGKLKVKGLPLVPLSDDQAEVDAAQICLQKKVRSLRAIDANGRAKVARFLASRGFSGAVISKVLQTLFQKN